MPVRFHDIEKTLFFCIGLFTLRKARFSSYAGQAAFAARGNFYFLALLFWRYAFGQAAYNDKPTQNEDECAGKRFTKSKHGGAWKSDQNLAQEVSQGFYCINTGS